MLPKRRHNSTLVLGAILVLLCLFSRHGAADIITLKTGGTLRGEIVTQDKQTITLRLPYGTMIIQKSHVKSVEKEDALRLLLAESEVLLKDGRTDEAIGKLEETVARFPASATARERLVRVYKLRAAGLREKGEPLEADRLYRRILQLDPGDEEAARRTKDVDRIRSNAPEAEKEAQLLAALERYQEALSIFDELAVFMPETAARNREVVAECHAGYGRRLLEFKRFEEARSHYEKAVKLCPELLARYRHEVVIARFSPMVKEINEKGKTLPDARWQALAAQLRALIVLEKDNPHLHYALAVCHHELGQYKDAARGYARVTGEQPDLNDLPASLAPLQAAAQKKTEGSPIMLSFPRPRFTSVRGGPAQILETTHFIIHHHNDELALLAARGAEYYLRRNYKVFLKEMPEKPWPKKCHVYVYPTKEEYLKNSRQASWSPAMASTTGIAGVLERHHVMTYQTVDDLLSSHLSHEITHIIHGAVSRYGGSLPTWLREGIAVRQEPWWKRIRMARVIREAQESGTLMTLEALLSQKGYPEEKQVNLFYAQSYALVEALQRAGTPEDLTELSREILRKDALEAIKEVYDLSREDLVSRWKKHEADLISLLEAP